MTTPEIPAFEPDVSLMCDDPFGGVRCTRTHGHTGDHVAHGGGRPPLLRTWPQLRLSDVLGADGFLPGPPSSLRDAVLADAMERLQEAAENVCENCGRPVVPVAQVLPPGGGFIHASAADMLACEASTRQAQTRAAKEIEAAHADPNWLDGS